MRKFLTIILLMIGVFVGAQEYPIYSDVQIYGYLIVSGDSIQTTYLVVDSVKFPDGSILRAAKPDSAVISDTALVALTSLSGGGSSDSSWAEIDVTDTARIAILKSGLNGTVVDSTSIKSDTIKIKDPGSGVVIGSLYFDGSDNLIIEDLEGSTIEMGLLGGISLNAANYNIALNTSYPIELNGSSIDLNGVGTNKTGGHVYSGTVDPTNTIRSNYDGNFHVTGFKADTAYMDTVSAKKGKFDTVQTPLVVVGTDSIDGSTDPQVWIEGTQFRKINFRDTTYTDHVDGRVYKDDGTKSLVYQNDISGFNHNLGYELVKRVYNNSGSTILNGRAVRRTGTHINDSRVPTIALAGNSTLDSANVCGVTTVDIPNNSYGIVTIIGDINFLNTTALAEDDFYLGHAGALIDTSPPPPYISERLGCVIYSDNDSGIVSLNPREPEYNPSPIFFSDTSGLSETVTITVQNQWEYLPLGNNSISQNFGFTVTGDSIQIQSDGYYQLVLSMSFQGTATGATWQYGIFINDTLEHKKTRSTSTNAIGDANVPLGRQLSKDDWISFRLRNTTGTTSPTIVDMASQILFLHL